MGLLTPDSWQAEWIGAVAKVEAADLKPSATIQLRKEFALDKEIQRAVAYVCGLGFYELRLNGQKVGDRVLDPGWTNYRKTCLYSAYDVTGQLTRGRNAIGVMLGNGMYNVPGGRYVKFTGSLGPPKVILHLYVEHADGTSTVVASDGSWTWAPSPVVFSCNYDVPTFYRGLGGIASDRAGPGFKKIIIQPQIVGDLNAANVAYDSPHGRIVSNWERDAGRLTMDVAIPANTTATVYVPAKDAAGVTESGKAIVPGSGVEFLRTENNAAVYAVGSGTYRFQSSLPDAAN